MNTQMNKSQFDWYMKWFKTTVRYIVRDLEHCDEMRYFDCGDSLTDDEKVDLNILISEVKSYCLDLYDDYVYGRKDIREYVHELKVHFSVYFNTELCFFVYSEPAMSPDEPPSAAYNCLYVDFEGLHFSILEEQHDEYMCEMAETHGMGYTYIEDIMEERENAAYWSEHRNVRDEDMMDIPDFDDEDLPF